MSDEKRLDWVDAPAHPRGHEILDNMRQHHAEEKDLPVLERLDRAGKRVLGEKPLHVQVAEALGWTDVARAELASGMSEEWFGIPPGMKHGEAWEANGGHGLPEVPPYGEDSPQGWACTGPQVGQYGINLQSSGVDAVPPKEVLWRARRYGRSWADSGWYPSATEAIARCVVDIAAARKRPLREARWGARL